ncbi:EF-P beta-lysylation protein EpmB [Vibrio sp. UCD-FRSSP16_10]|uniref:EF-P beta-lysylation protein EpmB n=1 Tax=unclassified Vibrio TaxID=2614977 RepID=UPI000801C0E5|nr:MULTISPECIES: EF-P beta-lysylation protein EpmB [unclassified Vibrio]OBT16409.1 EF-P beta-lysylation protein EpmB [Vibrio sp. UCD-FRSSP16_30]OBT21273.1 EF-P beta-lysylation protein EpmB [Vibrio sp. UCD-FRSSP16_10]
MPHIITQKPVSVEQNWLQQLANGISDPSKLLSMLDINPQDCANSLSARKLFAQRVPISFIERMEKGNPNDPLLMQVLPVDAEFNEVAGFTTDPLEEQGNQQPSLLHKYKSRVLLILKGSCAVNCRYCFRRHFPYEDNKGSKSIWQQNLEYIAQHPQINEVILSGGDPLMAKDHELEWLIQQIEKIEHVRTLRIHSRLPVVIPARVTEALCSMLKQTSLNTVLVTHINHPNEINRELTTAMSKLKQSNVTLLNQSVMLKGINDDVATLTQLSEQLFNVGILPYYMHVLDKVQGAAHFHISDEKAKALIAELMTEVSGYLVPTLTREVGGKGSKTPLDLHLE